MIKALSLAAVLALAPLSVAAAQDEPDTTAAEAALEAAGAAFEARMAEFEARAALVEDDESLTDLQRASAIMTLWAEYEPEVMAFVEYAASQAGAIAAEALADMDVGSLVAEATAQAAAVGGGVATNGAWASNDPEHMETYGLMAQYALGEVEDAMDEADLEMQAARAELTEARIEAAAAAASAPRD